MKVSWQCRLLQLALRLLVKPRLTAAHGVAPLRAAMDRLAGLAPRPPRRIAVEPAQLGGVGGEWLRSGRPAGDRAPVILYFHGGAYIAGAPRLCRPLLWRMAERCGGGVFAADYRLAPEHPFPAALDDAVACYGALVDGGIAPERIIVAGDSAGGGLALALALRIKAGPEAPRLPAGLVLISPWLDLTLTATSLAANSACDPVLQLVLLEPARRMYAPDGRYDDPFVSPLFGTLAGLPPVLVQVGTREILLDDSRSLAARMRVAGVDHVLEEWPGMHHVWHLSPVMVPEARRALAAIGRFIAGTCRAVDGHAA